jgi:hypothetical protein
MPRNAPSDFLSAWREYAFLVDLVRLEECEGRIPSGEALRLLQSDPSYYEFLKGKVTQLDLTVSLSPSQLISATRDLRIRVLEAYPELKDKIADLNRGASRE